MSEYPVTKRLLAFLILPLLVCVLVGVREAQKSLPDYNKTASVKVIDNALTIYRDMYGVPYVEAASDKDAFFAMGYAQAQDRLWQMEVLRRLASGRLSEVFGRNALQSDELMRTLGLYNAASQSLESFDNQAIKSLEAYASGVNSWLLVAKQLPPEFAIFSIEPEQWRPSDSLALIKLFSLALSGNFQRELELQLSRQILSPMHFASLSGNEAAVDFVSNEAGESNVADESFFTGEASQLVSLLNTQRHLATVYGLGGQNVGSNAWVIAGEHTQSGDAILANDPHLQLQIPSVWYAASIRGENINASGMSLVGLPVVVLGKNQHIAWGATNMLADSQDLIVEQFHPQDPNVYLHGDDWRDINYREEIINIAADFPSALSRSIKPVKLRVGSTDNGPIISQVIGANSQFLSLKWTALLAEDTTYQSIFNLNYASDWNGFKSALSGFVSPALNFLYSDTEGNIGFKAAGKIPMRRIGNGSFPVFSVDHSWSGFIPWNEMPERFNPQSGYIINANNRIVEDDYPHFISGQWADPARANRIHQLISEKIANDQKINMSDVVEMQQDLMDINAGRFVSELAHLLSSDANAKASKILVDWDGDMEQDSHAPAFYVAFLRHLKRYVFLDEFQSVNGTVTAGQSSVLMVNQITVSKLIEILTANTYWCNRIDTPEVETCQDAVTQASYLANDELTKLAGSKYQDWRWKALVQKTYNHSLSGSNEIIDDLVQRVVPGNGTPDTVNVASFYFDSRRGYIQNIGADFRQVISQQGHILGGAPGQSGNVLSHHYDDMLHNTSSGESYRFIPTEELVGKEGMARTKLVPTSEKS